MNELLNILTFVVFVVMGGLLPGFLIGCALTRRASQREMIYYQDRAEQWWTRCRELETSADPADWWKSYDGQ